MDFTPSERFRRYLETQGMRLTRERAIVVDEVLAIHGAINAEQIVARLDGRRVSRSTVYRALAELEKAGLLRKGERTNDRETYQDDD